MKIKGGDRVKRRILALGVEAEREVDTALLQAASQIERAAKKSIQSGPKTGVLYKKYNPRRSHRASAPGQAPASDTGRLANSIANEKVARLHYRVGTGVGYGKDLEHGTQTIKARPWLLPSFRRMLPGLRKALGAAIAKAGRRAGQKS